MLRRLISKRCAATLTPQPTPWTHPEMKKDEVIKGLTKQHFKDRRFQIMNQLISRADDTDLKPLSEMHGISRSEHILIITSASDTKMSNDIYYPFYQNPCFNWLCGFLEPDSILLIETIPGTPLPQHKSVLFVPKYEKENEISNGLRAGAEKAKELTGVHEAYDIDTFPEYIKKYAKMNARIWGDLLPGRISNMNLHVKYLHDGIMEASKNGAEIFSAAPVINYNRISKRPEEILAIRKSAEIGCEGMLDAMVVSKDNRSENYLSALFDFGCRSRGADPVFGCGTIIAGDERATLPHYDSNHFDIKDDSLVVASGTPRYSGYCSRIGRTWPISGKFTQEQAEIYDVVLFVHKGIINILKNKPTSLDECYVFMVLSLAQKLLELGFFQNTDKDKVLQEVRLLSPQFIGHHIGLDFHDTAEMSTDKKMFPGSVINIMPCLFIPADSQFPEKYHNIGVKIEDTILITSKGADVLTSLAPIEIDEIENIFNLSA